MWLVVGEIIDVARPLKRRRAPFGPVETVVVDIRRHGVGDEESNAATFRQARSQHGPADVELGPAQPMETTGKGRDNGWFRGTRTWHDGDTGHLEYIVRTAPRRYPGGGIRTEDQNQLVIAKLRKGVDGVRPAFPQYLPVVCLEVGDTVNCEAGHLPAMVGGR